MSANLENVNRIWKCSGTYVIVIRQVFYIIERVSEMDKKNMERIFSDTDYVHWSGTEEEKKVVEAAVEEFENEKKEHEEKKHALEEEVSSL